MLPVQRPELDAIYRQTVGKRARTVCVTAANQGEGVSTLALALARRGAAAGLRALLVDANLPRPSASGKLGRTRWTPADGSAAGKVAPGRDLDLAVLPAPVSVDPLAFRDSDAWRRMFEVDLAAYQLIVVDTSPVNSFHDRAIPAEPVAAACAATVLAVLTGVTSERSVQAAVERLRTAGATLCGAVFNDRYNPSLADELGQQVDRLAGVAPRLAGWLKRRIDGSAILNLQV